MVTANDNSASQASNDTVTQSSFSLRGLIIPLLVASLGISMGYFSTSQNLQRLTSMIMPSADELNHSFVHDIVEDDYESVDEPEQSTPDVSEKIQVSFINKENEPISLYWIDYNEQELLMATIAAKEQKKFDSHRTHMWVMRKTSNQEFLRSLVIDGKQDQFESTFQTEFHRKYLEVNGFPWLNVHPREPIHKHIPDPVEINHTVSVEVQPAHYTKANGLPALDSIHTVAIKTISMFPKIFFIEDLLSVDETEHIKQVVNEKGDLKRSGVKTTGEIIASRTSRTTWIEADHDDIVERVFRRAFSLMKLKFDDEWKTHSESLQIVVYNEAQEYQEHYDYFGIPEYPAYKLVQQGHNRYATLFMYLNSVEKGGETMFPRFNKTYVPNACTSPNGFRVQPKQGSASLFFSMLPDGNFDFDSLHGGCPVGKGETKWGSNLWFWSPGR